MKNKKTELSKDIFERFNRHIILKEIGMEGQKRLFNGKVLIIGLGGLGSPVSLYLTAAGVGKIGIVDSDKVELTNLQRQVIHFTSDIGKNKVDSAYQKMKEINPDTDIQRYHEFISAANIQQIIRDYDFVVDATDNFTSKFLINDACVLNNKPYSHGGILRFKGQTMTILPNESACFRCAFPEPPQKEAILPSSQVGILGAIPGTLGTIQAAEALKFLTRAGTLLTNTLLTFDALEMNFRKVRIPKDPNCSLCGKNPSIHNLADLQRT